MSQIGGAYVTSVPAVPVGSLQAYAGSSAPTGWLLCDGSAVSRTDYSNLFSTIGTTFGSGDGSTTFNVPDMRGRHPIGAGTGAGQGASGSGAPSGTALTARTLGAFGGDERMQSHSHDIQRSNLAAASTGADASALYRTLANTGATYTTTQSAGSGGGDNMSPYVVTNYIIKAIPDTPRGGMTATYTPPIVTALPASPSFGDQVIYAADATNGVYWHLQYDATGTYPWKFIGGSALSSQAGTNAQYGAGVTTTSTIAADLGGPYVTVPLAGDYQLQGSAMCLNSLGTNLGGCFFWIASDGATGWSFTDFALTTAATNGAAASISGTRLRTGLSASTQIALRYTTSNASNTAQFWNRYLSATPVRVKAA